MYCVDWVEENNIISNVNMSSQRISELFSQITHPLKNLFYKKWIKIASEDEFLALDITSISSYSKNIDECEYGHNRDNEKLPQINLCSLFGEKSFLPMYQTVYNGSLNDVKTLSSTIIEFFGIVGNFKFTIVMDKGFYSKDNINFLLAKNDIKFLISVPFTSNFTKNLILYVKNAIISPLNIVDKSQNKEQIFGISQKIIWNNNNITIYTGNEDIANSVILYAYIFYNPSKALKECEKLYSDIKTVYDESIIKGCVDKSKSFYNKFFIFNKSNNDNSLPFISINQDKIDDYLLNSGFFILLSNVNSDKQYFFNIYRKRDIVEKSFNNYKNHLCLDRYHIHGSKRMINKSFILFIAQIIYSAIYKKMLDIDLFKHMTIEKLLNEMKKIKSVTVNNTLYVRPLTKTQNNILKFFKIDPPKTL
jgi:transposase